MVKREKKVMAAAGREDEEVASVISESRFWTTRGKGKKKR